MIETAYNDLRNAQAQTIQASKLSALGEVGAGIAHELNQPLSVISGFLELVQLEKSPEEMFAKFSSQVATLQGQCERMGVIIGNIRSFSRETKGEHRPLVCRQPLEAALALTRSHLITKGIELELSMPKDELLIFGDPITLQQVYLNLLSNAKDAVCARHTDTTSAPVKTIELGIEEEGDHVLVWIEDSGTGIVQENRCRVFEPFFTTKGVGEGSGLGLSICHGIIEKHDGTMSLTGAKRGGARFELRLPKYDGELPVPPPKEEPQPPPEPIAPQAVRRVLVVDDEPLVKMMISLLFTKLGCDVQDASSAAEALAKLEHCTFDLIMSDITMPQMSGEEFMTTVRKKGIQTPMVLMTGLLRDEETKRAGQAGALDCLEKPVRMAEIERVLAMLNEPE